MSALNYVTNDITQTIKNRKAYLVLYTRNFFNKLSFRDFGELSRAVKREILVYLSRYKISPGVYPELIEGVEMTT